MERNSLIISSYPLCSILIRAAVNVFAKGSTEQVWPKSGAETKPLSKEHYCLMLLRDLEVKPSFAIDFSTQFSTVGTGSPTVGTGSPIVGTGSPIVHIMSSEVPRWQLVDELLRQEDGLKDLCLFWPSGTESVSQHLLLLGQESTVTVLHQQRTRSHVCIAHSEHRPWYLPTSQRLTAQCLLAAGTVLCLASHWPSQQAEVNKKWQARKLSQGEIESHLPGYSQLWEWDYSQKTINPCPGN